MTEMLHIFRKDPDAKLDYAIDWSEWLASGETISASAWTIPTGLTNESETFDDDSTKVWLSGGTDGETYTVANKITSSEGRIDERTFQIMVGHR